MLTKSSKAKGRRLQQWVAQKIGLLLGYEVGPDEHVASRGMGQRGSDIRLSKEALKRFPWSIECKNSERWEIHDWIRQAQLNRKEGTDWLLIASRNNYRPVVVMDCEAFFRLVGGKNDSNGNEGI